MRIEESIALVTGANRGLGKACTQALLDAGARKVYAAARSPVDSIDSRVVPIRLDITSPEQVRAAADRCGDVGLLINNAGVMHAVPVLAEAAAAALHTEFDVNVFGLMAMARAFAPVLARNGGGVMVNMLSVTAWFVSPLNPTYCVSKAASAAVTEAIRSELRTAGTKVLGVYAGLIDTDMVAVVDRPKVSPHDVAERMLQGIAAEEEYILADRRAEELWKVLQGAPAVIARAMSVR